MALSSHELLCPDLKIPDTFLCFQPHIPRFSCIPQRKTRPSIYRMSVRDPFPLSQSFLRSRSGTASEGHTLLSLEKWELEIARTGPPRPTPSLLCFSKATNRCMTHAQTQVYSFFHHEHVRGLTYYSQVPLPDYLCPCTSSCSRTSYITRTTFLATTPPG